VNGRKILSWLRAVGRAPATVFATVVLLWLSVEIWCVSDKTTSTDENRTLEPFPLVARVLEGDYDFGRRFERWFADHFRHRKSMVRLSGRIRLRGNSRVLHGKDGWLYLNVQGAPQCFSHVNRLDEGQLAVARRRTAEFGRRAKAAGIGHVYFVFSNDKESICPEFYPDGHAKVHPESRFDQLWNALQGVTEDVTLLRFTEELKAAKSRTEVFCRCGTHLNDLASFLVYGWLADGIAADFPSFAKVGPSDCRFGRDDRHTDADLLTLGSIPFYSDGYRLNDFAELKSPTAQVTLDERRLGDIPRTVRHFRNVRIGNGLRLFLLTDSFGWRWRSYLAESVSDLQVVFIGGNHPFVLGAEERRELAALKPDILVVNFTERFLQRLLSLEFPKEEN